MRVLKLRQPFQCNTFYHKNKQKNKEFWKYVGISVAALNLCFEGGGDEVSDLHSDGCGRVIVADGEEGCLSNFG